MLLISAVETNRARATLQSRYPPLVLSASTRDLRAEVLGIGPPGRGTCLRCYNPPEPFADDDLRAQVGAGGEQAVRALAAEADVSAADVRRWLDRPDCDEVGNRLLAALQRNASEPAPLAGAPGDRRVVTDPGGLECLPRRGSRLRTAGTGSGCRWVQVAGGDALLVRIGDRDLPRTPGCRPYRVDPHRARRACAGERRPRHVQVRGTWRGAGHRPVRERPRPAVSADGPDQAIGIFRKPGT